MKKPVEIVNVKSVNSVSEKVLEHDFYRSMSDLAGIRTLVMSSSSPVRRKDKDMRIEITAMKRHALLLALSQISDMKASCVAASDAVFRSLTEAQEEGGHALVSARARSLLLPAQHMGSKRSVRKGRSPRYARCGIEISQGSYSDLLLLGKELRVVEKVVKQSLRALGGYGDITSQRDVVDDTTDPFKEDLENFPHSPQTNSVQSRENQQWQDSSTSRSPARTPPTAKGSIPVPSHEIRILDPAPEHTSSPLDRNPSLEEDTKEGEAVSALHVPPPRADSARILEAKEITIPCDQGLTEVKEETRRPEDSVTPSASEGADNEQSIGR